MNQDIKNTFNKLNTRQKYITCLIFLICVFEGCIAISGVRSHLPDVIDGYDCLDILNMRPWYASINSVLFFLLALVPGLIFTAPNDAPRLRRYVYILFVIILSYILLIGATYMGMVIRNAPFQGVGIGYVNHEMVTSARDALKHNCIDIADGAKYLTVIALGWLPASLYTSLWLFIRWCYAKIKNT